MRALRLLDDADERPDVDERADERLRVDRFRDDEYDLLPVARLLTERLDERLRLDRLLWALRDVGRRADEVEREERLEWLRDLAFEADREVLRLRAREDELPRLREATERLPPRLAPRFPPPRPPRANTSGAAIRSTRPITNKLIDLWSSNLIS